MMIGERHTTSEPRPIDRRRLLRRVTEIAAVGLAVPVLAGCDLLSARQDDRYQIRLTADQRFDPASLTVPVGSTIVWDNTSSARHAVTMDARLFDEDVGIVLPDGVAPFTSVDLLPGDTWRRELTEPGTYVYVCPYHQDTGMLGMIVVEE